MKQQGLQKDIQQSHVKQIFMTLFFMSAIVVGVQYSKDAGSGDFASDASMEEQVPKASARGLASVSDEIQVVKIADGKEDKSSDLSALKDITDQQAFLADAQKEQMDESQMQQAIAELSEQLGWDLELRRKEDGGYAISNKVVERSYQDQPLVAFDEATWTNIEGHLLDVINQKTEHLTAEDHKALESWRGQ